MNNTNPFQNQNPFGTTNSTGHRTVLAALTLATHLSSQGLGRQTISAPADSHAVALRRSA